MAFPKQAAALFAEDRTVARRCSHARLLINIVTIEKIFNSDRVIAEQADGHGQKSVT